MNMLNQMHRTRGVLLALVALLAVVVVAVGVHFGLTPEHLIADLSVCVDWLDGFTGHTDGLALAAAGAAPALTKEVKDKLEELKGLQAKQDEWNEQIRGDIKKKVGVAEFTEKFEKINNDVAKKIDEVDESVQKMAEESTARQELIDQLNTRLDAMQARIKAGPGSIEGQTVFDRWTESDIFKRHRENNVDFIPKVNVEILPLRCFAYKATMDEKYEEILQKTISSDAGSAGPLADSRRLPGVIVEPNVMLNVQDLIPTTVIPERTVDFVKEKASSTLPTSADTVAETTDSASPTHKPEGDLDYELVTATMQTIANWVVASKQILEQASRTQLRAQVDGRLMYSVDLKLEDQVILGDGIAPNLDGLVPNAADYAQGYSQIQGADPTNLDILRRAQTQARLAEYPVTGHVLHPTDWQDIELLKGTDLHYIFAMPGTALAARVWGVPVTDSSRMTQGEFLTGAFSLGAELFINGGATIETTRSHKDWFTANMVVILAEMRALLAIYRSTAFVSGTFINPASTGA